MKPASFLIAASLTANLALLGYILLRPTTPTSYLPPHSADLNHPGPLLATDLATAFKTNNHAALRDILKAAGFPDDLVREIVQRRIWETFRTRYQALVRQADDSISWWKNVDDDETDPSLTRTTRKQLSELQRESEAELLRLFGPDPENDEYIDKKLAFLPAEKRLQIQKIEQDYFELKNEIQEEIAGFYTAEDTAKLRLLMEEEKRDILAVMSPEEQKAYDLRLSPTAESLRWDMTKLNVTEAEYLKIFALQKAFDEKYASNVDPFSPSYDSASTNPAWSDEERSAEEAKVKQQIRALIGDERFALSIKKQDSDYRQLQAATRRFDLPSDTPDRIYSLRDTVGTTARQIADNPSLSPETKKQALIQLATQTRNQVRTGLGSEVADAYFKNSGMRWLAALDEGNAVIFSKEDSSWNTTSPADSAEPPTN
jgi:hypothetical protein